VEAVRDFQWREYAPFGWILAIQLLFLVLVFNLASPLGMGTAGAAVRLFAGDSPVHYPTVFMFLPSAMSWLELFLYTVPGAFLIPLSVALIRSPMEPGLQGPELKARLRRAWPQALVGFLATVALVISWQWLFNKAFVQLIRSSFPALQANAAIWTLSLLGSYALSSLFLYVPIVAVDPGRPMWSALKDGILEGVRLFKWTILIVLVFALPAMPFLLAMQMMVSFMVERMRPEMIAIVVGLYAILISAGTYLTYAATARLHWASQVEEA
jgi:hypothetical protein